MSEAQHQGHPVSYWLKLLGSDEEPAQQEAVQVLMYPGASRGSGTLRGAEGCGLQVRHQAAVVLGAIGPEAKAAVPALIDVLQQEDKYFRSHGAVALGKIGREAGAAVPALIKALKDREEDVRREAAAALGRIGPGARAAVADLVELLKDPRKPVRKQAVQALEEIDASAAAPHLHFWSRFRQWLG
jgi:HEAT repeat protein